MDNKEIEKLQRDVTELHSKLTSLSDAKGKSKEGEPNKDAIQKDEVQKMLEAVAKQLALSNAANDKPAKKLIYGGKDELKANEERISFQKYMAVIKEPWRYEEYKKTVMSIGTDAQGGYTVPTEWASQIIGEMNEITSIIPKCTNITQGVPTLNITKLLTDLSIGWTDEAGVKTATKPTFERKQSVLKKMTAIVTMTDELLDDTISDLTGLIQKLIAENMANEIERLVLVGDVTGLTDPFNGIYYATNTRINDCAGANLAYTDLVNAVLGLGTGANLGTNVLSKYLKGAEWYMNRVALHKCMTLLDNNNRPLWNINNAYDKPFMSILGSKINVSDQIGNALGAASNKTAIIYGNYKNVILAGKKGDTGINVKVSNDGIISSGTEVSENLFQQDETGFRFVKRQGVLVAIPEAFYVIDEVELA